MADPTGSRLTVSRRFNLHPSSAGRVRAFLEDELRLDSIRRAEAALLVTEVIANSIKHATIDHVEVSLAEKGRTIQIAVTHEATEAPAEADRGLGFTLLDALSETWGMDFDTGALTTWFEVRSPGAFTLSPETLSDDELLRHLHEQPIYGDELIRRYESLAASIARRYRGKGVSDEDLQQVALIALVKAIHRYDPSKGELPPFAAATISGELKRQLRDRAWSVHVPRGLQERAMAVSSAIEELTQSTGHVPSVSEVGDAVGLEIEAVVEALGVGHGYRAISLDQETESQSAPKELLGMVDTSLLETADRTSIDEALMSLPERERLIVYLRFYEDMTQSQIAETVGMSQMHVSRLLARSLAELRDLLDTDD